MKLWFPFFALTCIFFCSFILIQNNSDVLLKKLDSYTNSIPQEKIYIHHDKEYYLLDEDIWLKVYLVDSKTHRPRTASSVAIVALYDEQDSLLVKQYIKMAKDQSHGDFHIERDWIPGKYTLRGYSQYMCNFDSSYYFQSSIQIIDPENEEILLTQNIKQEPEGFQFHFFPEGGEIIAGLKNRVAFKASNQFGTPIDIEGTLFDSDKNKIQDFKSIHDGLGYVEFVPTKETEYSAIIYYQNQSKRVDLPKAQNEGYVMKIDNTFENSYTIKLNSSAEKSLEGCFLIGHIRGIPFLQLDSLEGNEAIIKLNKSELSAGIAHITFFDSDTKPHCERLVYFAKPTNTSIIQSQLMTMDLTTKTLTEIELSLDTKKSKASYDYDISATIIDMDQVPQNKYPESIASYLLFSSDLSSFVHNPSYYFNNTSRKKRFITDLLLMTHGWRRFTWRDIIEEKPKELIFVPQTGFDISGTVRKKNRKKEAIKSNVFLTVLSDDFQMHSVETLENGRFLFPNLQINDSTALIIQANKYKEKKKQKEIGPDGNRNVLIDLDKNILPANFPPVIHEAIGLANNRVELKNLSIAGKETLRAKRYLADGMNIELEEVTIKERKIDRIKAYDRPNQLYSNPDNRLITDSISWIGGHNTVFDVVRSLVSGATVRGTQNIDQEIVLRGVRNLQSTKIGAARILVDGVPASSAYVNSIRMDQVEYIDVLKSLSKTSIYGALGAGGIIAIYLRKGGKRKTPSKTAKGTINMRHEGYYEAREFFMPNYADSPNNGGLPDLRSTLYWNPNVKFNKKGKGTLRFYTSEKSGTYKLIVQGLCENGTPIIEEFDFEVK